MINIEASIENSEIDNDLVVTATFGEATSDPSRFIKKGKGVRKKKSG